MRNTRPAGGFPLDVRPRYERGVTRAAQIADRVIAAVAGALLVSVAIAAWHDVSKAWDVWYYHLPFAARINGLMDASSYGLGRLNQARFDGFPLLGEALQGLLWRITGRPESAALVSFAALPGLAWFLRKTFAVPAHVAVLALLAIPLVQIHSTSCYVDFPANACVAILALLVFRQIVRREAPSLRVLLGGAALAIAAANMKFQLVPVVIVTSVALVATALRRDPQRRLRLLVIAIALPLVFATPIKNMVRHGNPVWPVELHVLGQSLPHLEGAYASSPDWLANMPRPVRWSASVLELGLRPVASHARWSLDQWTPPREPGYRMGGFFGAYVIVNVAALLLAAFVRRSRESKVALAVAAAATVVASLMPQSHELRYYMFWMLLLVSLNLVVWSRERPVTTGLVAAVALAIVAWSTGGAYLYASGDSFATLVSDHVDRAALDRIAPGERICVARPPWTFLYAPRFHPDRQYAIQEAETPDDCEGARPLD
jgi:hypothetical protein